MPPQKFRILGLEIRATPSREQRSGHSASHRGSQPQSLGSPLSMETSASAIDPREQTYCRCDVRPSFCPCTPWRDSAPGLSIRGVFPSSLPVSRRLREALQNYAGCPPRHQFQHRVVDRSVRAIFLWAANLCKVKFQHLPYSAYVSRFQKAIGVFIPGFFWKPPSVMIHQSTDKGWTKTFNVVKLRVFQDKPASLVSTVVAYVSPRTLTSTKLQLLRDLW